MDAITEDLEVHEDDVPSFLAAEAKTRDAKDPEAIVYQVDVNEIHDEITGLAYELERASRRLRTWCTERPVDYVIVCELARGVAISAERVAAQLKEQTDQLKPFIYGPEGAEATMRLRQEQQERLKRQEREREERRVRWNERGREVEEYA